MAVQQLLIYLMVYLIPGTTLFGSACLIVTRNYQNTTNRLIALLIYLYSLVFFEELIRHLLPMSYSPFMVHLFLETIGMLIISVTLHFFLHVTKLHERIKILFYPLICYIPFFTVVSALIFNVHFLNRTEFIQQGIWYVPVFDTHYYITLSIFTIVIILFIGILGNGIKYTSSPNRKKVLRLFAYGTFIGLISMIMLAYPNFSEVLPPHPYLIIGIIFPILLMIAAHTFNLLPSDAKKYQTMFNLIPASIIVVNSDWEIIETNDYSRKEIMRSGQQGSNLLDFVHTSENKEVLHRFIDQLEQLGTLRNYPLSFITTDRRTIHFSVEASAVSLEKQTLYYLIWRNVTEELENDRLIEHMAYHDGLTTLHNRAYFVSNVKKRIMQLAIKPSGYSALILIDLNHFKQINDTHGHAVGDQVLQHTAMLLKQAVRTNDLVARLGGDEFVIFLENFPSPKAIYDWNDRLQNTFKQNPFINELSTLQVEPSIGIAFFPTDADTFESLFQLADSNMYANKLKSREKKDSTKS